MVWMANHPHLLVRAFDAKAFKNFYMELQKKLTEYIKRLTGSKHLLLWEGRAQVSKVEDVEKAIQRIAYFYQNPSRANLVNSIEEYPLLNTWEIFNECACDLTAQVTTKVPWIRLPTVKRLRSRRVTEPEDRQLAERLTQQAKFQHELTIMPNDWMRAFGITQGAEVARINEQIRKETAAGEAQSAAERLKRSSGVVGAKRLRQQEILKSHIPAKKSRINFILASTKELRIAYIKKVREIFSECTRLYRLACRGELVSWPAGVFPPAIVPLANAVG